jgi:hypothetical protein
MDDSNDLSLKKSTHYIYNISLGKILSRYLKRNIGVLFLYSHIYNLTILLIVIELEIHGLDVVELRLFSNFDIT